MEHSHDELHIEKNVWKSMHPYKVGFFVALGAFTVWFAVVVTIVIILVAFGSGDSSTSDPFNAN